MLRASRHSLNVLWLSNAIARLQGAAKTKIFAAVEAVAACHGCPGAGQALAALDRAITIANTGGGTNKNANKRSVIDTLFALDG